MTETKTPAKRARAPAYSEETLKGVLRVEIKLDYMKEELANQQRQLSDHETRVRSLEASEAKRQGGVNTASFLYGAVWPAVSFCIAATALYLQYRAYHPGS